MVSLGASLRGFLPDFDVFSGALRLGKERRELDHVTQSLLKVEETLLSGLLPTSEQWGKLALLPSPWGKLAGESIQELRATGAAVVPSLRRLRELSERHASTLAEARAKSSQALAQAGACAALVPLFGSMLYVLVPGITDYPRVWFAACVAAFGLAGAAACWMMSMANRARWAGLEVERRGWLLAAQCMAERFLALVRSGHPADVAYSEACVGFSEGEVELGGYWGHSAWLSAEEGSPLKGASVAANLLAGLGASIRRAVQVSLMEGTPCTPRVEAALIALSGDLRAATEREVAVLSTRCLLPLFLLVAPALLGLMIAGFYIAWLSSGVGADL